MVQRFVSTALLASLSLAACVDPDDTAEGRESREEQKEEEMRPLAVDGAYALSSAIDIQAAAVVPPRVYEGIELLRGLRDEPGRTLFDLAESAGVPAVGTVRSALPSSLESRLYGWIDDEVASVTRGDGPVADGIAVALAAAETVLTQVDLTSDLTLAGGVATHRLRGASFDLPGVTVEVDLDALAGTPVATSAQASARIDGTTLALGGHSFGLPLGTMAYDAVQEALRQRYGRDLRGLLGEVVDCPELAQRVSDKCVVGVCVGHESELRTICDAGLDKLVEEVADRFAEMDVEVLALRAGRATLVDGNGDRVVEAIAGGVWTAEIDVSQGLRPAPATFAGARR